MYKLFLCLRYLRSRVIAYFAMLAVALCVFMVLVAVSVMDGFLKKIELAAKGLFGDIVIEVPGQQGIMYYDELIEAFKKVPRVEAASPFILSYGVLRIPGQQTYRQPVQIAGIRLPQRADVSDFAKGLYVQRNASKPTFSPPLEQMVQSVEQEMARTEKILTRETGGANYLNMTPNQRETANKFHNAIAFQGDALQRLKDSELQVKACQALAAELDKAVADKQPEAAIAPLRKRLEQARKYCLAPPDRHIILGLGIPGLSFRTEKGDTIRLMPPGQDVVLYVFPLGKQITATELSPNVATFTIVDDCRTDVSSIDSEIVYIPFDTLQRLNNMAAEESADEPGKIAIPARCSQIHVKVKNSSTNSEASLREVRDEIERAWIAFRESHPAIQGTPLLIQTWQERQAPLVQPIRAQRTLVVIMFGIISMVAVVLILVLFYTIVIQKTKDIGVIKAIGASSWGVAQVFLMYGGAIGFVGAVLGTIGGHVFVWYINPIHTWIGDTFGFTVWNFKTFLFEKIPNEVQPTTAAMVFLSAILAGIVGAIVPAIRAARMQPVEAIRYE